MGRWGLAAAGQRSESSDNGSFWGAARFRRVPQKHKEVSWLYGLGSSAWDLGLIGFRRGFFQRILT